MHGGSAGDSDGDGLCDNTEGELGTDPQAIDSDGDRLPDLIEVVSNFVPVDAADPVGDQIAFMEGSAGSNLDFGAPSTATGRASQGGSAPRARSTETT